jgi:hypothetical protein
MGMMRRHGWWVLLVIVLAVAAFWPRQGNRAVVPVPCEDITAGCALPQAKLKVRFDRQPDALQRFKVFVELSGVSKVHASFSMRDMEMGLNRYRLLPAGPGRWEAEVMLPACIQGRKDWLVRLDAGAARYEVPFSSR